VDPVLINEKSLQEHEINPFTKQPHSAQYKKILDARKKLPVYAQMDDFYKMVSGVRFRIASERGS
jgi:pre-mRNA-splicing factor ATP-dependent RNA helicase DHX15/PRP43